MPKVMLTLVAIVLLVVVFFSGVALGLKAAKPADAAPAADSQSSATTAGDPSPGGETATADRPGQGGSSPLPAAGGHDPARGPGVAPLTGEQPGPEARSPTTGTWPGRRLVTRTGSTKAPADLSGATPEERAAAEAEAARAKAVREETLYRLPSDYRLRALEYASTDTFKLTDEQREQVALIAEQMRLKTKAELHGTMQELEQAQAVVQDLYRQRSEVQQGLDQQYMDQLRAILTAEQLDVIEGRVKPAGKSASGSQAAP